MIIVERPIHLTGKSNGSHGSWFTKAKEAKAERSPIADEVDRLTNSLTPGGAAFTREKVAYMGRWRGRKVQKTKMVRRLHPLWQARVDAGITVHLERRAERKLDDDNLRRGFKHIRDGVADAFGIRDDDPRITFTYDDVRIVPSAVVVTIRWAE